MMHIFLAGDSTVNTAGSDDTRNDAEKAATIDTVNFQGWGDRLQFYIDREQALVKNYALSGRSSKSFLNEKNYAKIWDEAQAGDYLLVQFGHNDEKIGGPAGTEPIGGKDSEGAFAWYLYHKYIVPAREKGMSTVLITPVSRRSLAGSVNEGSHGMYPFAVKNLAKETGVPLIDLESKSADLLRSIYAVYGPWGTAPLFAVKEDGSGDLTHFNPKGALRIAGLVAEGLGEAGLLKGILKEAV
jgi:lysophospholipase L1-like esterase